MEAMDQRKKSRLIKGIIFNIIISTGCIIYLMDFVMPKYNEIDVLTTNINDMMSNNAILKNTGVDKNSFVELLNKFGKKKEVPDIVFSDVEKLSKVLTKPVTVKKDYLSWLIEENGKVNVLNKEIQENDRILGNIIPVFVNSSTVNASNDIDNQITLASFISYVEKNILSKYALTSYVPIGISNIIFPDKKDTPVNIGSFKINLDFKGKNSNILALIDSLQKSGKFTIRNGKLISDESMDGTPKKEGLSGLSNLLVNIDSFTLTKIPSSPSEQNEGNIVLEFYVEGMNYQKILILRSLLVTKFEWLQKSVREKSLLCAKLWNPLCNETVTANAIATIKGLVKNLSAVQPKIDAFKKGDITIDINKEMDTLFDIKATLQTIEMIYLKNNSILEKAKKQTSNK